MCDLWVKADVTDRRGTLQFRPGWGATPGGPQGQGLPPRLGIYTCDISGVVTCLLSRVGLLGWTGLPIRELWLPLSGAALSLLLLALSGASSAWGEDAGQGEPSGRQPTRGPRKRTDTC